jgi:phthalate 4,5-dioxygenase
MQDQAITESMGPTTDHTFEHLAPSDQLITRPRRRLLMAACALRDKNILPPGIEDAEVFCGARGGYFVSDDKNPWQEVYVRQLDVALHCCTPCPRVWHRKVGHRLIAGPSRPSLTVAWL